MVQAILVCGQNQSKLLIKITQQHIWNVDVVTF